RGRCVPGPDPPRSSARCYRSRPLRGDGSGELLGMFPLWDDIIAPVIDALRARRVIEIGALRGETTTRMLKRLGGDCELHVIDPAPQFDPAEHERAFPGRYHFHLGASHDVLGDLPPADVVLVDGDHNWYTVYHELRLLAETSRRTRTPLPVLVPHDVGWPYGRRDLYYAPERIPAEHRQPHRQAGMRPGRSALMDNGGLNRDMQDRKSTRLNSSHVKISYAVFC